MLTVLIVWCVASFFVACFVGRAIRHGQKASARARLASRSTDPAVGRNVEVA